MSNGIFACRINKATWSLLAMSPQTWDTWPTAKINTSTWTNEPNESQKLSIASTTLNKPQLGICVCVQNDWPHFHKPPKWSIADGIGRSLVSCLGGCCMMANDGFASRLETWSIRLDLRELRTIWFAHRSENSNSTNNNNNNTCESIGMICKRKAPNCVGSERKREEARRSAAISQSQSSILHVPARKANTQAAFGSA